MKAYLHSINCPDVDDITNFEPSTASFAIPLQLMVGPAENRESEESFDLVVCSPDWLSQEKQPVIGNHFLITNEFSYGALEQFFREYLASCHGEDWRAVALKVARLGRWEFEDYREKT